MGLFYSAARAGFFDDTIHTTLPDDAVAITPQQHADLIAAQTAGRVIRPGPDGHPVAKLPAVDVARRRALLVEATKREAARRILAAAPIWRQLNDARDLALSTGAARMAIENRVAAIDAIRTASDLLEHRITAMGTRGLAQVDVAAPSHWPA